jgi:hypothetical protein
MLSKPRNDSQPAFMNAGSLDSGQIHFGVIEGGEGVSCGEKPLQSGEHLFSAAILREIVVNQRYAMRPGHRPTLSPIETAQLALCYLPIRAKRPIPLLSNLTIAVSVG